MKTLKNLLITLAFIVAHQGLNAQDVFTLINIYDKRDEPDSAFALIDKYEKIFLQESKYDSLVALSNDKIKLGNRYKTKDFVSKAIATGERYGSHLEKIHKYNFILKLLKAGHLGELGRLEQAMNIYDEVETLTNNTTKELKKYYLKATADKTFLYLRMGEPSKSKALGEIIAKDSLMLKDSSALLGLFQSLTIANQWLGQYEDAIYYSQKNIDLVKARFPPLHPNIGLLYENLASIYADLGDFTLALENYKIAEEIQHYNYIKSGSDFYPDLLGSLGLLYSKIGEDKISIDYLDYSLQLNLKINKDDDYDLLWLYNQLSTSYRLYKDIDKAAFYNQKAANILKKNPSDYDLLIHKTNTSEILYEQDSLQKALSLALDVNAVYDSNPDIGSVNDWLHITNLITNIYEALGDKSNTSHWMAKNVAKHEELLGELSPLRLDVLTNSMRFQNESGDTLATNKTINTILKLRNNGNEDYKLINCIPTNNMVPFCAEWASILDKNIRENNSDEKKYFEFLQDFESYYQGHLSTIKSNSAISSNQDALKTIYRPAIRTLSESDQERSLIQIEKIKSFATRQILQSYLIDDKNMPTININALENRMDLEGTFDDVIFKKIANSIDSLANYKDSLFQNDKLKFEKYFGIGEIDINNIRSNIEKNELLIEFYFDDNTLFAYYVDKTSILSKKMDYHQVDSLTKLLLTDYQKSTSEIMQKTLLPDEIIEKYDNLLIIPDGTLNLLNFEQLTYKNLPLIYSKKVRYAQSNTILNYQHRLSMTLNKNTNLIGFTPGFTKDFKQKIRLTDDSNDSLFYNLLQQPFLLSLSQALASTFTSGQFYNKLDATESRFNQSSADYNILHIATHGIIDENSPLYSKIIFAKDSLEDGNLHLFEIYGKNLNSKLVVLSACSSGKENSFASEGVISMANAFTNAGCPSVLMTLWDVDEKTTSIIIEQFYKNLEKGLTKSVALRNSKLDFLKNSPSEYHHPYYWAGLVIIGDDSPLFTHLHNYAFFFLIGVFLLITYFLITPHFMKKS